jgi:hypothetical protein
MKEAVLFLSHELLNRKDEPRKNLDLFSRGRPGIVLVRVMTVVTA